MGMRRRRTKADYERHAKETTRKVKSKAFDPQGARGAAWHEAYERHRAWYNRQRSKGHMRLFLESLRDRLARVRSDIDFVLKDHPLRYWDDRYKENIKTKCVETRDKLDELIAELSAPVIPDPSREPRSPLELTVERDDGSDFPHIPRGISPNFRRCLEPGQVS
jgi:hypothetical protein